MLSSVNEQICNSIWRQGRYIIQRTDKRTLITSVGDVTFDCTYFKRRSPKSGYTYLLADLISLDKHERFSEEAEVLLLTEALKTSYQEVTRVLPSKQQITKTLYYTTRNTQKVLEEDAFLAWTNQEGETKESFSILPTHRDDYFPGSENPVITFRRSYRDLTSFQTIGTSLEEQEIGALLEDGNALIQQMEGTEGKFLKDGAYVVYERLEGGGSAVARAEQLKEGMLKIQKGDLESRIDVGGREDEIGMLAEGLNDMATELETYIKKVYVAEIRQREAELDALKSQIKLHYLYNTLEVIRMTVLEHEDTETARMVESLSKQLKYLIGCNSDRVLLKRALENIREYFYIMRIRYENRIELDVSAQPEALEASIIKLSLQPIVENAVRHGLRPKRKGELFGSRRQYRRTAWSLQ